MRRLGPLLLLIIIFFCGSVFYRYYQWVAQADSPFDEVGIGLHSYMPGPIQSWGCARLKERFEGKTLPPHGCKDPANPRGWRRS
ncbi:hypothetical protein BN1110_04109 [bacterium YEK0313]|nr:hypothetical protein BN1110_04109 [bacterium YEK0313]